jgi:hypothetical protein
MKKIKLVMAAVAMLSLVSSSAVYADGFAPGEGLYIGGFGGVGMGMVQPKVTAGGDQAEAASSQNGANNGRVGNFEATSGGLGLEGMEGGVWVGYGYKMGSLYAGIEGEWAGGDVEFELTSPEGVTFNDGTNDSTDDANDKITSIKAQKDFTGGMFGSIGYYVNSSTLLSVKGGVLVSKFDVDYGTQSESYYGGGPALGVSLASQITAIDPNLSVRMETVYTDFLTAQANMGIGTTDSKNYNGEITGSALSARVGLQYSFFDVNSLF